MVLIQCVRGAARMQLGASQGVFFVFFVGVQLSYGPEDEGLNVLP